MDVILLEYPDESHNFTNIIFVYSILNINWLVPTGNSGSGIAPQDAYCKITVFAWGKNTIPNL